MTFWAGLDPELATTMDGILTELQEELAGRSRNGTLTIVDGATHEMPFERPDAVVEAIRSVLGQAGAG